MGGSLAVVLPKEAVAELDVEEGDKLFLTKTPDGSYRITAADPDFEKQMKAARSIMKRYRNTLRALAK